MDGRIVTGTSERASGLGPELVRWTARAAGAGAFGGAAAQAAALGVQHLSLRLTDAVAAASVAALLGACLGALGALAPFLVRRRLGRATDAAARGRASSAVRAAVFVLLGGASLGLAAVLSLAHHAALEYSAWIVGLLAVATLGAAWLGWRCGDVRALRWNKPPGFADAVGTAGALAFAGATTRSSVPAWLAALALALCALAVLRAPRVTTRPAACGLGAAFLAVALYVFLPARGPALPDAPVRAPRSVVLIVLDTLRADHLGPYGGPTGATPTFDRIAAEGTLFEDVISTSPWTLPSHASMFTGLYPREHLCWWGDQRWLPEESDTVADRLRAEGFETVAMLSNDYLRHANVLQGFDRRLHAFGALDRLMMTHAMRRTGLGFTRWIDKGAAEIEADLDAWLSDRDPERPFFLFVNLFEVHEKFQPPFADRELPEGASWWTAVDAIQRYHGTRWHSLRRTDGLVADVLRALYAGEVRYQDRALGRLLAILDAHVDPADVALVVTSDHGDNHGDGGRWGHMFALNEALVRLPLVIRAPGRFPAGARVGGTFSNLDLAPTLLELAGLPGEIGEGRSLFPERRAPRAAAFSEVFPDYQAIQHARIAIRESLAHFQWGLTSVRKGGLKLVVSEHGLPSLYDVVADPAEERDLAAQRPADVAALLAELDAWRAARPRSDGAPLGDAPSAPMDESTRAMLNQLGY